MVTMSLAIWLPQDMQPDFPAIIIAEVDHENNWRVTNGVEPALVPAIEEYLRDFAATAALNMDGQYIPVPEALYAEAVRLCLPPTHYVDEPEIYRARGVVY